MTLEHLRAILGSLSSGRQTYACKLALVWLEQQGVVLRCRPTARGQIAAAVDGVCLRLGLDAAAQWNAWVQAAENKPRKRKGHPQQILWQQLQQEEELPVESDGRLVVSHVEVQMADELDYEQTLEQLTGATEAQRSYVPWQAVCWLRHRGWLIDSDQLLNLIAAVAWQLIVEDDSEQAPHELLEQWVGVALQYAGEKKQICSPERSLLSGEAMSVDDLASLRAEVRRLSRDLKQLRAELEELREQMGSDLTERKQQW